MTNLTATAPVNRMYWSAKFQLWYGTTSTNVDVYCDEFIYDYYDADQRECEQREDVANPDFWLNVTGNHVAKNCPMSAAASLLKTLRD